MTGITRSAAAKIIAEHFGTSAVHVGGTYDTYNYLGLEQIMNTAAGHYNRKAE